MRVLQVTPYFAPAWAYGGPPRVMYDYATGLVRRGHEVAVFTTDVLDEHRRAGPAHEVLEGVDVFRFPNLSNGLAWRAKKYLPRGLVSGLARELSRFDAVHVTDARTLPTAAAYAAARRSRIPLCLSAHGSLPGSPGAWGVLKQGYDRVLVEPMLRSAALLLAQTQHEAGLYVQAGGRSSAVRMLPLPVEHPSAHDGAAFRERTGLPAEAKVVLFLGRIHPLKGLDLLVAALEPLLREGGAVLAAVGRDDGHQLEVEQRFARLVDSGRLRFLGPVYGDERFSAYAAADVFCLTPPHWEETSVAALEAASCGTPVVVSEQADLPGLEAAGGGFVVPLESGAILTAVERALDGGEEMGARAREHVRRQHSRDAVVGRLESYLEGLV